MAISHVLKSGSLAALAAALATLALPAAASAQDSDGDRRGGRFEQAQPDGGSGRGQRNGGWAPGRSVERSQPAARAQAPAQPPAQAQAQAAPQGGSWRGRGPDGNGGNTRWRQQGGAASAPPVAANPAPRQRTWQGERTRQPDRTDGQAWANRGQPPQNQATPGWTGRNRSYADPERTRTYQDTARNDRRDDRTRNRGDGNGIWRGERRDDNSASRNDRRNDSWRGNNRWNDGNRNAWSHNNNRNWNRDWRRDSRYNWSGYRTHNRSHYRLDPYYAPYRGYSYRRLGIGFTLDALFFGSRYWISDPWSYRLPDVDGPYRWVRYYDDVILVDIYTGEVVDVIHDFFW